MRFEQICACRIKTVVLFLGMLVSVTFLNEVAKQMRIFEYYSLLRSAAGRKINFARKFLDTQPTVAMYNQSQFVPGGFLKGILPLNESYCMFNYGAPETLDINDSYISFTPEQGDRSPYRVLYNVVEGFISYTPTQDISKNIDITYCTHVTPEFVYHITEIVQRWDGPVSVAAFVPNIDASLTLSQINQMCRCLPEMSKISLHFVFPKEYPPTVSESCNDANIFSEGCPKISFDDCSLSNGLLPSKTLTFRHQNSLSYPVNVARNVARAAAVTTHVLVSDVELLPSKGLVTGFRQVLSKINKKYMSSRITSYGHKNYVFVIPVFEVHESIKDIPQTKSELLDLYDQSKAVYFHRWICTHCQRFPGLQKWLQRKKGSSDLISIQPLLVAKREFPYHRWEPVYIGTNQEPLYSELLSWEGQQDKMSQMAEMCLIGYRFVILDGAFLIHRQGIKRRSDITKENSAWRKPHELRNTRMYKIITDRLKQKYTSNVRCRL